MLKAASISVAVRADMKLTAPGLAETAQLPVELAPALLVDHLVELGEPAADRADRGSAASVCRPPYQ